MQQTAVRIIWWAALAAGASYMLPVLAGWQGPAIIAWKGAGVTLLALWAALQARDANPEGEGWLIALVLAFGALGDVLLDAVGLTTGAAAFAVGHVIAIILYARNRRPALSPSQTLFGWLIAPLGVVITIALVHGQPDAMLAIAYAALVGSMAAFAWTSRFPRYRTGIGAVMFLVSDLVIFAGQTVWTGTIWPKLLIWPLYFGGQALIAWGVVKTLQAANRG
ncbi:lysoplasmalogenase [Sphingomonas lacunae]|uniref:Lysoplasmalogenase n=1 Tax=Sphingomonas lacunae TaxID=2698828 RepID=A0A6M4B0E4_9SPHN|nr:lysoplasmalogenase [Sphingomonas lacunae]QJQ32811.1 lysoplasmalogenase [Sphingomonas lacunae]